MRIKKMNGDEEGNSFYHLRQLSDDCILTKDGEVYEAEMADDAGQSGESCIVLWPMH
jgi:hypothetical protein